MTSSCLWVSSSTAGHPWMQKRSADPHGDMEELVSMYTGRGTLMTSPPSRPGLATPLYRMHRPPPHRPAPPHPPRPTHPIRQSRVAAAGSGAGGLPVRVRAACRFGGSHVWRSPVQARHAGLQITDLQEYGFTDYGSTDHRLQVTQITDYRLQGRGGAVL